jgi:hypothetical protein
MNKALAGLRVAFVCFAIQDATVLATGPETSSRIDSRRPTPGDPSKYAFAAMPRDAYRPLAGSVAASGVISVPAGGDLQAALDAANPGDTILLQAGATFTGNFVLRAKSGSSYITIRSSAPDGYLPPAGVRMDPGWAPQLPKLRSGNTMSALVTMPGAHHYRLSFLEFLPNAEGMGDIIALGDGSSAQNTLDAVPHDLVLDRVYIHGDANAGQKRGIGLNSASTSVLNSYISDIKAVGQDSQAIGGWNGPGPFTITNNYLEAAGENVMFGGADPAIQQLVPSDITITKNNFSKPLAWRSASWSVKNLFELKNAQRVTVDGNVFENNWAAGQAGYAIVLTPRNQNGTAPWSVVQQVAFTNNIVRHVSSGINILGTDNEQSSLRTNNIVFRNNFFADVSAAAYGGAGRFVLLGGGDAITFDHNTVIQDGATSVYGDGLQTTRLVFTNNIVPDNAYGIMGSNASPGNGTIEMYFPASQFIRNVFPGATASTYPPNNYYPASMTNVGFVSLVAGDYRLRPSSAYHNAATDGTDIGCIWETLLAAQPPAPPAPTRFRVVSGL